MSQKFHNAGRTYAVGKAETDAELARRLARARVRDAMAEGDRIDYRAMLAREAFAERVWRMESVRATPVGIAIVDMIACKGGLSLREHVELINGEPLA